MTQIDHTWIIDLFGGIRPLSKELGHENPSTVQGWADRGVIPTRRQPEVLEAARHLGLALSEKSFFQSASNDAASPAQGAA